MSLARLWQSQGKNTEARQMLADIAQWFTEGFDTADLQEAQALLETLSDEERQRVRRLSGRTKNGRSANKSH